MWKCHQIKWAVRKNTKIWRKRSIRLSQFLIGSEFLNTRKEIGKKLMKNVKSQVDLGVEQYEEIIKRKDLPFQGNYFKSSSGERLFFKKGIFSTTHFKLILCVFHRGWGNHDLISITLFLEKNFLHTLFFIILPYHRTKKGIKCRFDIWT